MKCPHCGKDIQVRLSTGFGGRSSEPSAPADLNDAQILMDAIDPVTLNDFETKFYNDMKSRMEKFKDKAMVSTKQLAVLKKMVDKGF